MNQHVRELPRPRERSAPATLEFQWERFPAIAKELPPLFKRHWEELAANRDTIPLEPFWQQYFDLDMIGVLRILTVRVDGVLSGYVFIAFAPHLHYASTLWASYDMFWLDPVHRQGWAGIKMLLEAERQMRAWGAKAITLSKKIAFDKANDGRMHKLLVRLGYRPRDVVYVKVL